MAPELQSMVGSTVIALIPWIHKTELQEVTLLGVEHGGVWVEVNALTQEALGAIGEQTIAKAPIYFFPYSQITCLIAKGEAPGLSEKAFGL